MSKIGKVVYQLPPLPRWVKKVGELWSLNEKLIEPNVYRPQYTFSGDYISALRECCPFKFLHALEIDLGLIAHTTTGTGVPPPNFFNRENLKFGLQCSVWALITSGLVRISSPNFSRLVMNFNWSTYWPTQIACCTVIWHKSIRHVFLFGLIRQLPLLREEFRLSKFTLHSDLWRRAVSRLALPCTSSFCHVYACLTHCRYSDCRTRPGSTHTAVCATTSRRRWTKLPADWHPSGRWFCCWTVSIISVQLWPWGVCPGCRTRGRNTSTSCWRPTALTSWRCAASATTSSASSTASGWIDRWFTLASTRSPPSIAKNSSTCSSTC